MKFFYSFLTITVDKKLFKNNVCKVFFSFIYFKLLLINSVKYSPFNIPSKSVIS